MFEALGERLTGVFDRLTGRGVLSEKDIDEALREVRLALLDADVALPVVKDFIAKARESATGEAVLRAVKPSGVPGTGTWLPHTSLVAAVTSWFASSTDIV